MHRKKDDLTSRELLARIGLGDEAPNNLLDDELPDDLSGDLSAVLCECYHAFNERHRFAPGDLVTWKPGLKNRTVPRYGSPAVVMELLETSVRDTERESGCTYFREPLDLVLGLIVDWGPARGELMTFHFDSRRLQPWSEEMRP